MILKIRNLKNQTIRGSLVILKSQRNGSSRKYDQIRASTVVVALEVLFTNKVEN